MSGVRCWGMDEMNPKYIPKILWDRMRKTLFDFNQVHPDLVHEMVIYVSKTIRDEHLKLPQWKDKKREL